jgi:hypothetical protein
MLLFASGKSIMEWQRGQNMDKALDSDLPHGLAAEDAMVLVVQKN